MRIAALFLIYYGSVVYSFFNPLFGLLFYVHITILRPDSLAWGASVFGRLHLMAATLALVGYLLRRAQGVKPTAGPSQRMNLILFGCFLAWLVVVSLMAQVSQVASFEKLLDLAKIFALCFIFSRILKEPKHFNLYVWVVGVSFGLLGFWGFLQGLAGNPRLDDLWPGGSNYIAAQLALMIPLVVAKALESGGPWFQKPLFVGSAIGMTLCAIFTESRGGFLGLAVALAVMAISVKQRLQVALIVVLGAVLILPWVPTNYVNRITGTFAEEGQRDESSESRFVMWAIAFHIWQDYPLTGVGLGNFSPVKENYADQVRELISTQSLYDLIFNRERHPHGLYQGMLAEAGIVGVACFLSLFAFNVLRFLPRGQLADEEARGRLIMKMKATRAGLIGFAASAVFGDFQYIETFYWQLFFLGALRDYLTEGPQNANIPVENHSGTHIPTDSSVHPA
ncbi:MAG: hypothetical protein E8D47_13290 [Nitrospira sp.]|nr:MAG: hypothetical protein E8D47_13290 [Nitrospira sp.]